MNAFDLLGEPLFLFVESFFILLHLLNYLSVFLYGINKVFLESVSLDNEFGSASEFFQVMFLL